MRGDKQQPGVTSVIIERLSRSVSEEVESALWPLAMRPFWEITPRASAHLMRHPVKILLMSCLMYVTASAETRQALAWWELIVLSVISECICSLLPYTDRKRSALVFAISGLSLCAGYFIRTRYFIVPWRVALHVSVSYVTHHAFVTYVSYTCWRTAAPDYTRFSAYWTTRKNTMLLGKLRYPNNEEVIVGTLGIEHHTDHVAIFKRMAVAPEARGLGVATKLIRAATERCKDSECKYIALNVSQFQQEAHKLYQRAGFRRFSTDVWYFFVHMDWYYLKLDGSELNEGEQKFLVNCIHTP